jgi:lysyl-tRNA synthetase class 2
MKELSTPLRHRAEFLQCIRDFFRGQNFLEVETPLLVGSGAIEPALDPFSFSGAGRSGQLPTSPEFQLKRLVSDYQCDLFEISRAFRDEPVSDLHQPEFTLLEWYRVKKDYDSLMEDCALLLTALNDWLGARFPYNVNLPDLMHVQHATAAAVFRRHANLELADFLPPAPGEKLVAEARRRGHLGNVPAGWDDAYFAIFLNEIEPHLGKTGPLLLYDYPASQCALARLKPDDPRWAERVELYLAGVELGNGFSELTDLAEQKRRYEKSNLERTIAGKPPHPEPATLFAALDAGLPSCAGMAIGLDRLYMLLCGAKSVSEVRFLSD